MNAFETFLGFRNRFNGRDAEFLRQRRVKGDSYSLPAVFHAENGRGQSTTEAKIRVARGRLKKAVGLRRRQEVHNRLDADRDRLIARLLQLQDDSAGDFTTIARGTVGA